MAEAKPKPSVEEMSVLDLNFNDLSPDEHGSGPFKIFKVEMCEYQRKWMAMAYYRKLDEAEPTGLLEEWPLQTPVMELLRSRTQSNSHTHSIARSLPHHKPNPLRPHHQCRLGGLDWSSPTSTG